MVDLDTIVSAYIRANPTEVPRLGLLVTQLDDEETMNDRRNFHGHITASGIVLSPDKTRLLLIHHKAFSRWQQPGGHWEAGEADPLAVARRETAEETGLTKLEYMPVDGARPLVPLNLGSHPIPARPDRDEPGHFHHDFCYVFLASSETVTAGQDDGVDGVRWFSFDAPECALVQEPIVKLRRYGFIA